MQHTEVPHELDNRQERLSKTEEDIKNHPERILQPGDKIVYAAIRSFMDETRSCYPSIVRIKERAKCGQSKIEEAIQRLVKAELMQVKIATSSKGHSCNLYIFPETEFDKHFEMFTLDFLKLDIPVNIKEYYMSIQKYMYDKESGVGKIGYNNTRLADLTGLTVKTVRKYNNYLIAHGLLEEEATGTYDSAGLPIVKKNFNLNGFQQAALWIKAVTEQLQTNTQDISDVKDDVEELKNELALAKAEISELKRQNVLRNNEESTTYKF